VRDKSEQEQLFAPTRPSTSLTRDIITRCRCARENAARAILHFHSSVCPLPFLTEIEDGFRDYAEFIRREWDAGTTVTISRIRELAINKDTGSAL